MYELVITKMPTFSTISFFLACIFSQHLINLAWKPPNPLPKAPYNGPHEEYIISKLRYLRFLLRLTTVFVYLHYFYVMKYPSPTPFFCPDTSLLSPTLFTWSPFSILCISTTIVTCLFRLNAFKELGQDFSFQLAKPKRLFTGGMYAYVQHPAYTATFCFSIANAMLVGRLDGLTACWLPSVVVRQAWWANWVIFILTVGGAVWSTILRVREEEKMLKEAFGEEWVDWHEKTPRYIPWLF
jgi:protein-S-isoprenylcysteine O-methyltransferase Ste14